MNAQHSGEEQPFTEREQVGWMNPQSGVICDCPVYERSPHANSVPVYREVQRAR